MKKHLFLLLALCYSCALMAYGVRIKGINYKIPKYGNTAEVTYTCRYSPSYYKKPRNAYSGDIVVPAMVKYRGKVYQVKIDDWAFDNCPKLTSVTISEGVEIIGNTFKQCPNLVSVKIPNSAKTVYISGGLAKNEHKIIEPIYSSKLFVYMPRGFAGNYKIPEGVEEINSYAFANCINLSAVTLPKSVKKIGYSAFYNCKKLTSIDIPNGVEEIDSRAFEGDKNIKHIYLPASVKKISADAFPESVTHVYVDPKNTNYCDIDGVVFSRNMKTIVFYPPAKSATHYTIPYDVTKINSLAFKNCKNLEIVYLPQGLTEIGTNAFNGCENLKSITLPNNVTIIGSFSFGGCEKLESINIPAGVTEIGIRTFRGCKNLKTLIIPNSVTKIGKSAFVYCESLQEIKYPWSLDMSKTEIPATTKKSSYDPKNPPKDVIAATNKKASTTTVKENKLPPMLALIPGSTSFTEPSKNKKIDAGEKCTIRFSIKNNGKGAAMDCEARIHLSGTADGLTVKTVKLPTIYVGQTYEVSVPIMANIDTKNGKVTFIIEVYEPSGWGVAPFDLTVDTKAYEPPYIQVVDHKLSSASGKIRKMEPFTLALSLQNTKYGKAEQVKVKINLPDNILVMDGSQEQTFSLIKSGEAKNISLVLAANNNYQSTNVPISVEITEKYGRFAENKRIDIALNQAASSSTTIAGKNEPKDERKEIAYAMLTSDVDRNIPITETKNQNTFVLIVANENYKRVEKVPFALNDGNIFREYCNKTLGIGEKRIHCIQDATYNQIKEEVKWLKNITETFNDANIIFYYSGHGIPDESCKSAYLLPVDGSADVSTGYKLDELYATLGKMPASHITIFLDACFSGATRDNKMVAQAKGVALKAKSGVPQGNMIVFSAAQEDETAGFNKEEQHGLFTYYLLKKLQETKGDVTLKELGNYIITNVKQQSILQNSKLQTPCVTPSSSLGSDWQNWKLK